MRPSASLRKAPSIRRAPRPAGARATTVTVVVGAQFGDEAKGKISDFLAADVGYVVRSAGGPNTGHTIHLPEGVVVLHQLSCGVLRPRVRAVSGPGMVINPFKLEEEIQELERRGLLRGEVVLSDRAHVLLPIHEMEDAWQDELRAKTNPAASLGTTRRGIGPAYEDRYGRFGIRLGELSRPATVRERLETLYATKPYLTNLPAIGELASRLTEVGARLAPYIRSTEPLLWDAIGRGESVLLEGAQSALLDLDFGTYPFVTSSHPTSAGAVVGSGIPPTDVDAIVGITKAYCTRVGAGPFPTEDLGEGGEFLRRAGGERGATTGRERRCGWLDLVLLRYVARLNGLTALAVTKVDILGGQDAIPICVGYLLPDGTTVRDISPFHADDLAQMRPVYERLPAWPAIHERTKERLRREGGAALPAGLRRFLHRITQETGVPVEFVGYGPGRDETVHLGRTRTASRDDGLPAWTG